MGKRGYCVIAYHRRALKQDWDSFHTSVCRDLSAIHDKCKQKTSLQVTKVKTKFSHILGKLDWAFNNQAQELTAFKHD